MKPKLALSLAGGRMLLEVVWPARRRGVRDLLRALIPGRKPHSQTLAQPRSVRVSASEVGTHDQIGPALEQLMSQLKARQGLSLSGLDLEVQLGLDHAHIGLMSLADVAATSLSSAALASYANAWVAQMLHLDPAAQIVRQRILADPHKVLISCVDRGVFEVLQELASRHGLRFRSCRPAVLSAISAEQEAASVGTSDQHGRTVVWTELDANSSRSNRVQLLRFAGKELAATWRGWVPASRADGSDAELEGAVRRFDAHHSARSGDAQRHLRWPSDAADALRA